MAERDLKISALEAQLADREQTIDKWKTLYYEAQEWICSCNHTGDPSTEYICQWHEQKPSDDEIIGMVAQLDLIRDQVNRLKRLLKRCEWSAHDFVNWNHQHVCPICGEVKVLARHRADCELAAELKETE